MNSLKATVLCLVTQSCLTLCNPMDCNPPGSSVHGDSPDKNIGVGCHGLLPTQGLNPGFPHCKQILYHLNHQGSPKRDKWVVYPSAGDLPNPGVKLTSPVSPALTDIFFTTEPSGSPRVVMCVLSHSVMSDSLQAHGL